MTWPAILFAAVPLAGIAVLITLGIFDWLDRRAAREESGPANTRDQRSG